MAQRNLHNIYLKNNAEPYDYSPTNNARDNSKYPIRKNRDTHAKFLQSQFEKAWKDSEDSSAVSTTTNKGVYLEIKGKEGYELLTKSLENLQQHVRICNIKESEKGIKCATVYIPNNKKNFFIQKLNKYKETAKSEKVIDSVESIHLAMVESFWIGDKKNLPKDIADWCEVWLIVENNENSDEISNAFFSICKNNQIPHKKEIIKFPERCVVGIRANKRQLASLLHENSKIAEFRKMVTPVKFFLDLELKEQKNWGEDLLKRTNISKTSNTAICLLDTGVNNGHPLLESVLKHSDMHSVIPNKDKYDNNGHGTKMAGIATYFNIEEKIESMDTIEVNHFLESVKIMDTGTENQQELYGAKTADGISLTEIENPNINRIICMAITSTDTGVIGDGRPTSWSGAIDSIIAGVYESEGLDDKRLMFVSAGNTCVEEIKAAGDYKTAVINHSVEDPAQSWNAITVGAYTEKIFLHNDENEQEYSSYNVVAESGSFSPFTSSSLSWNKKWPIKPDIVLEGGNLAYDSSLNFYSELEELQLLTTSKDFKTANYFDVISMTSSATAQAAWLGANIQNQFAQMWSETIRGLLVHSAEWTKEMKNKILGNKKNTKTDFRELLRICGYGVPSLERAIKSAKNSVNIVIEDEIQPFIKKNSSITLNEMHIHDLPWAKDLLLTLGDTKVRMKVTLSFYIEPGPGEIGWKDKYRYPSCGLLFDVNNQFEDKDNFSKRISKAMREDETDKGEIKNDSSRWLLGANNRNMGSIHSDVWEGTAGELSGSNYIVIYPTTGWWKTRTNLRKYNSKVRYSLIVTIETPEVEVDLYTQIINNVKTKIAIETKTK